MNLRKAITKLTTANIASKIINLLVIVYMARFLGASAMGIYFVFRATLQAFSLLSDLGFQGALVKRMSEGESPRTYVGSALVSIGILVTVVSIGIFAFRNHIGGFIGADLALDLIVALILTESWKFCSNILKGELRVEETSSIRLARIFSFALGVVAFTELGFGVRGPVLSYIGSSVVALGLGLFKINVGIDPPSKRGVSSLFKYAKFDVFTSLSGMMYRWGDVLILATFLSTESHIAAYETAWRVSGVFLLIGRAVENSIIPQISRWHALSETEKIESIIPGSLLASALLVFPGTVGAYLLGSEILAQIFTPDFAVAGLALFILTLGRLGEALDRVLKGAISGMNLPQRRAIIIVISFSLNLFLNILLIPLFGIDGAAVSSAISIYLSLIMSFMFSYRIIDIKVPFTSFAWCFLCSITMGAILIVAKRFLPATNVMQIAVLVVVGGAIYLPLSVAKGDVRQKLLDLR